MTQITTSKAAVREVRVAENETKLEGLAGLAIETLQAYLKDTEPDKNDTVRARVAATVLSSWTRHNQTQGAREATQFMMARELARDKEELRKYIEATMPGNAMVKALPEPKG